MMAHSLWTYKLINSFGDTFIEIVTPVKENTTAERFLNRRGGNGGYMVIVDCDDVAKEKERVTMKILELFMKLREAKAT